MQHLFGLPLMFFKSRQVGAIVTRVRELDTIRAIYRYCALLCPSRLVAHTKNAGGD
ncbi:RTX toxin transporter [Vibrio cholerae]|nr:RTX toxin transporter [Vibrio cholerae]